MAGTNGLVAIVNPTAGGGRAVRHWRRVVARLDHHQVTLETWHSEAPGHATVLARRAVAEGYGTVIAVGGDGTVQEVVNGLTIDGRLHPDVRLGVVPAGTGMDFARNMATPRGIEAAVRRILSGRDRMVDVGLALPCNRLFVNFAETGLGAAVVAREAQYPSHLPGRISFFTAAIQAAVAEDNLDVHITVDGLLVYAGPAVSVVAANGSYFGGGMKIAPGASLQDGQLDVLVLGDFRRLELVGQIWKIYPGIHVHHPKVLVRRGTRVQIEPLGPSRLDLDGELVSCPAPYSLTVLPSALRVLV